MLGDKVVNFLMGITYRRCSKNKLAQKQKCAKAYFITNVYYARICFITLAFELNVTTLFDVK